MSVLISKFPRGVGKVKVILKDASGNKYSKDLLELQDVTMEVTNPETAVYSGNERFPKAYALGNGECTITATKTNVLDDELWKEVQGYIKVSSSDAVYTDYDLVKDITSTSVDISGDLGSGEAWIDETIEVKFIDTEIQLDRDYTVSPAEDEFYFDPNTSIFTFNSANVGRRIRINVLSSKSGYEYAYDSTFKGMCMELYLIYPLMNIDCTVDSDEYLIIYVPRAFLVPNRTIAMAKDTEFTETITWKAITDGSGYVYYEGALINPDPEGS